MSFEITHLKPDEYISTNDGMVIDNRPENIWDVYHADDFKEEFPNRYYVDWGAKDFERAIRVAVIHSGPLNLRKIYIRSHVEPDLAVVNLIANAAKRRCKTGLQLVWSWLGFVFSFGDWRR